MPKQSAGLLVYRMREAQPEVFLVHPGGPFWAKKDAGAWSIPKGEIDDNENPADTAQREFREETGFGIVGPLFELGCVKQAGGKIIHAFAAGADFDAEAIQSNRFQMEWPPRSGRLAEFPEVDRAGWFSIDAATAKINPAQAEFLPRLRTALSNVRN